MGRKLSSIFHSTERDLDAAYMKIHPDVYFSKISFIALISIIIPATLLLSSSMGLFSNITTFNLLVQLSPIIPLIVIMIGIVLPKIITSNRISSLKIEIPYASMYMSVMTSGGLSPYESLLRLRHTDLLPEMRKEISRIETIVTSTGVDPLTAMEQAARVVNLNEYKELLLGYASTVRTGGDTLHYLFNQTKSMFKQLSSSIKGMGERMGILMEAYTIVGILGVLGLFLIYLVGMSLPAARIGISSEQFFLFSFVILPVISLFFIYVCDTIQISYPISNWKPYIIFAVFMPLGIFVGTQIVLSFYDETFLLIPFLRDLIISIRLVLNFAEGTEVAIGMAMTLVIIATPGLVADHLFIRKEKSLQHGITLFLRDLVETRKSGLSPERCIEALSRRDYMNFSKHLRKMNMDLSWGQPIRKVFGEFKAKVKGWLPLINVYLLIDTIEVGGGTEESLETLAEFSESTKQLDDEKKSALMPLAIVPYIGVGLLVVTTVSFLNFLTNMSMLGVSIPHVILFRSLLPPLVLHSFILGLVSGKIISGRISAGFKHSFFMMLVALGGVWAVSNISMSFL